MCIVKICKKRAAVAFVRLLHWALIIVRAKSERPHSPGGRPVGAGMPRAPEQRAGKVRPAHPAVVGAVRQHAAVSTGGVPFPRGLARVQLGILGANADFGDFPMKGALG